MNGIKSETFGVQTNLFEDVVFPKPEKATGSVTAAPVVAVTGAMAVPASAAVPEPPAVDGRSTAAWRQWLSSMASDAEAALAAAIAYREMDVAGRERWLASLEFDAPAVDVPAIALYAPLLAVESDPDRRERLIFAMGEAFAGGDTSAESSVPEQAFSGAARDGTQVYVVATPLYLKFCQVLACGVSRGEFQWVKHDPIVGLGGVPAPGDELKGARLQKAPMKAVLDELAVAVLSHQRSGKKLPDALSILGDLLGPLSL